MCVFGQSTLEDALYPTNRQTATDNRTATTCVSGWPLLHYYSFYHIYGYAESSTFLLRGTIPLSVRSVHPGDSRWRLFSASAWPCGARADGAGTGDEQAIHPKLLFDCMPERTCFFRYHQPVVTEQAPSRLLVGTGAQAHAVRLHDVLCHFAASPVWQGRCACHWSDILGHIRARHRHWLCRRQCVKTQSLVRILPYGHAAGYHREHRPGAESQGVVAGLTNLAGSGDRRRVPTGNCAGTGPCIPCSFSAPSCGTAQTAHSWTDQCRPSS